jgi:hypothetical protein
MTPKSDKEQRVQALTRLAIATREKAEPQTFAVYLDDTSRVSTHVLLEACRRLEKSSTWFPKVAELLEQCNLVAKEHQIRAELNRPRLREASYEASEEKKAQFREQWKALMQGKRMAGSAK